MQYKKSNIKSISACKLFYLLLSEGNNKKRKTKREEQNGKCGLTLNI